jgi:hypothetical protein
MSGRCRTGEGVKPALESVRAAQKDVAVARAQRSGSLPEAKPVELLPRVRAAKRGCTGKLLIII